MSSPYGEPESALPDLASVWDQELEDSPEDAQARLVERRIEYLAPLMAYVRARGEQPGRLLNRASLVALGAGEPINRSGRLWARPLERGLSVIPPWLVERCCALLGQTVAAVMGDEWVKRFGVDGRGGEGEGEGGTRESAPVDSPRIRRPNRSDLAFWQSEDSNHAA